MSKTFECYLDGSWQKMPKGKDLYNTVKDAGLPIRILWDSGKAYVIANRDNAPEVKIKTKTKAKAKAKQSPRSAAKTAGKTKTKPKYTPEDFVVDDDGCVVGSWS